MSTTNQPEAIYAAMCAVMADVGAVRKSEKNAQQGFNFRGIDNVTNAVYPAFVKHGVFCTPHVVSCETEVVTVGKNGTVMNRVLLEVVFTFYAAADGSCISSHVRSEAMDAGDKATAKAMSVALRTCLLQTFMLPTDEPDPDHDTYERSSVTARPVTARPAMAPAQSSGALNKSQTIWGEKQARKLDYASLLDAATKLLGRPVSSLNDLSEADALVLLPALSDAERGS
jgi:hypothetical protein